MSGGIEQYVVGRVIGKGSFGEVHLCYHRSDQESPMVLKRIDMTTMNDDERIAAMKEVQLLMNLNHPCIVAYVDHFFDQETLCIVMEYCAGGDLSQRIRMAQEQHQKFSEYDVLTWFSQIALALQSCHRQRVLHRDLKTQNIYLTDSLVIKLGDFGIARVLENTHELAVSVVGTPYTMSPEVCNSAPYSFKSDVWALGCVLFEMCELTHAFNASNLLGLVWKIVKDPAPPIGKEYSHELAELVQWLLNKDADQRPSIDQVLAYPLVHDHIHKLVATNTQHHEHSHTQRPVTATSSCESQTIRPNSQADYSSNTMNGTVRAAGTTQKGRSAELYSTSDFKFDESQSRYDESIADSMHFGNTFDQPMTSTVRPDSTIRDATTMLWNNSVHPNAMTRPIPVVNSLQSTVVHEPSQFHADFTTRPATQSSAVQPLHQHHHAHAELQQPPPKRDNIDDIMNNHPEAAHMTPKERLAYRKQLEANRRISELSMAAKDVTSNMATAHELKWAQHKSSAALATDDLQRRQQQHHAQLAKPSPAKQAPSSPTPPTPVSSVQPSRPVASSPTRPQTTTLAQSNAGFEDRPIKSAGAYNLDAAVGFSPQKNDRPADRPPVMAPKKLAFDMNNTYDNESFYDDEEFEEDEFSVVSSTKDERKMFEAMRQASVDPARAPVKPRSESIDARPVLLATPQQKAEALKERILSMISKQEFDSIYRYYQQQSTLKNGGDVSQKTLESKFGRARVEICKQIEILMFFELQSGHFR